MLKVTSRATLEYSESLCHRSIRLLDLKPGSGEEVVHFDVETHSLDHHPDYVALSYTWGDPADTISVLCGGRIVNVTRNLRNALWQLRENRKKLLRQKHSTLRRSQSLRLWIDAVCIDQLNPDEKSFQVGLMAEIYERACHVIVWLGPADKNTDMVVDYLNMIGEKAEACGMAEGCEPYRDVWLDMAFAPLGHHRFDSPYIRFQKIDGTVLSVSRMTLRCLFDSISGWAGQDSLLPVAGMKEFFTRPWWGRIWVLQEITFAKNADFVCGSRIITKTRCSAAVNAYSTLWEVLTVAFRRDRESFTRYQREIMLSIFQHRPRVMLSMPRINRQGGFCLAALLRATCVGTINSNRHGPHHLESTRPEDKIFALLGLATDREDLMRRGVFPKYGIPYEQIYTTTMAALLEQGHISLLSMCQASKSPNLPSWVPDWSQSVTNMLQDVENDHMTLYPTFNTSGNQTHRSEVRILRDQETILDISVLGHVYDEIYQVGRFKNRADSKVVPLEETFSWPVEWLLEIVRLTYCTRNKYKGFADRLRAAGRTSIGDIGYDENAQLVRVGDFRFTDAAVLVQGASWCITNKRIKAEAHRFLANRTTKNTLKATARKKNQLVLDINGKSLGRLPFVTKKGHLGLSSEYILSGDIVAVILGSQVPFVLRPRGEGKYQVISEAYVDGIMNGEATRSSDCSTIHLV
jgi:hypothetical protein